MLQFLLNDLWVFLNPFLLVFGIWLVGWNAYFLVFNKGIPNIKTAKPIREAIIARLKKIALESGKDHFTIIDLGCGNGHFSAEIARAIPNAKVVGIEVSKLSFLQAEARRKRTKLSNLEFRNADFYESDISEADAVVMFLLGTLMGYIRKKLEADLKPGTYVFSNKFKVGGEWAPLEAVNIRTLWPNQKTFYIYKKSTD